MATGLPCCVTSSIIPPRSQRHLIQEATISVIHRGKAEIMIACKFFAKIRCARGDSCPFAHIVPREAATRDVVNTTVKSQTMRWRPDVPSFIPSANINSSKILEETSLLKTIVSQVQIANDAVLTQRSSSSQMSLQSSQ
jgi:hypothetical protein